MNKILPNVLDLLLSFQKTKKIHEVHYIYRLMLSLFSDVLVDKTYVVLLLHVKQILIAHMGPNINNTIGAIVQLTLFVSVKEVH